MQPSNMPGPPPMFTTPEKPSTIKNAVYLMYASATLSVIGFIVTIATIDELRDTVEEADSSLSDSQIDTAVTFGLVFSGVMTVVGIALWLTLAHFISKGRDWARITGTVFFGLYTVSAICGLATQDNPALTNVLLGIGWLLALTITVLLWLPTSSAFFKATNNPFGTPPASGYGPR